MSQSFDLSGVTTITHNGADVNKLMLDGVRIWERYTATRQVWVSSGYSSTSWTTKGSNSGSTASWYLNSNTGNSFSNVSGVGPSYSTWGFSSGTTTLTSGSWRFVRAGQYKYYKTNSGARVYWYGYTVQQLVTTWVDTSSYQDESYTAYYY